MRGGCPSDAIQVRGWLWPLALGNPCAVNKALYLDLRTRKLPMEPWLSQQLEQDMPRTFPTLQLYARGGAFYAELRGLLETVAAWRPDIGCAPAALAPLTVADTRKDCLTLAPS